MHSLGKFRTTK